MTALALLLRPLLWYRRIRAAPALAARCNLLEERNEILEIHLSLAKGRLEEALRALELAKRSQSTEREIARAWLERCSDVTPRQN